METSFGLQVDAMLQKLEKEIDDVDAKIGDRWRLLDRFVNYLLRYWQFMLRFFSLLFPPFLPVTIVF